MLKYVTERKLSLANRLLRETNLRVFEIADRAGFASSAYFCRTFRKFFRQSPQAARNAAAAFSRTP